MDFCNSHHTTSMSRFSRKKQKHKPRTQAKGRRRGRSSSEADWVRGQIHCPTSHVSGLSKPYGLSEGREGGNTASLSARLEAHHLFVRRVIAVSFSDHLPLFFFNLHTVSVSLYSSMDCKAGKARERERENFTNMHTHPLPLPHTLPYIVSYPRPVLVCTRSP